MNPCSQRVGDSITLAASVKTFDRISDVYLQCHELSPLDVVGLAVIMITSAGPFYRCWLHRRTMTSISAYIFVRLTQHTIALRWQSGMNSIAGCSQEPSTMKAGPIQAVLGMWCHRTVVVRFYQRFQTEGYFIKAFNPDLVKCLCTSMAV